jgi:hypothetical protein
VFSLIKNLTNNFSEVLEKTKLFRGWTKV